MHGWIAGRWFWLVAPMTWVKHRDRHFSKLIKYTLWNHIQSTVFASQLHRILRIMLRRQLKWRLLGGQGRFFWTCLEMYCNRLFNRVFSFHFLLSHRFPTLIQRKFIKQYHWSNKRKNLWLLLGREQLMIEQNSRWSKRWLIVDSWLVGARFPSCLLPWARELLVMTTL